MSNKNLKAYVGAVGATKLTAIFVMACILGVFAVILTSNAFAETTGQMYTTNAEGIDQYDFAPGEIVYLHGMGFNPSSPVELQLFRPGETDPETCTIYSCHARFLDGIQSSDEEGDFVYRYDLNGVLGLYTVKASTDGVNFIETTFTDSISIESVTLNGGSSVNVPPSTSITAAVTVKLTGSYVWKATRYRIEGGSWNCVNTADYSSGTNTVTFPITAPANTGTYDVDFRAYEDDTCSGTHTSSTTLTDGITVSIPNPTLSSSCGIDMILVIDSSASIDNTELTQMKTAFKGFVDAFLPNTPTQISVIEFDTTAHTFYNYSNTPATIKSEIDAAVSDGYTNWEDALIKSYNMLGTGRNTKPHLVVFASDGNPNRIDGGTSATESAAVAAAVTRANQIKLGGTRIITLGIGNDLNPANLQAISSADAYYSTDFATLAQTLAALADDLCGGTISVKKLVDGNPASGWTFTASVTGGTPTPTSSTTDGTGFIDPVFKIDIPGASATASVTETPQGGYPFVSASCINQNQQSVGSCLNGACTGITIGKNDAIYCEFRNTHHGCENDNDCNYLDKTDCEGDKIMHVEGVCIDYQCTTGQPSVVQDCNDYDRNYCDGLLVKHDDGSCVGEVPYCNVTTTTTADCTVNNLYCNANEQLIQETGYCSKNAQCGVHTDTTNCVYTAYNCNGNSVEQETGFCDESMNPDQCSNSKAIIENCDQYNQNSCSDVYYWVHHTGTCIPGQSKCAQASSTGDCRDQYWCDGQEYCYQNTGTCVDGTPFDCSENDISGIATCDNIPDQYHPTWDYRVAFTSQCVESVAVPNQGYCTNGDTTITHTCDTVCGAECDATHACANKCVSNVFYTEGQCQGDCTCSYRQIGCDDQIACTIDSCDAATGCSHTPDNSLCDDGDPCTQDICDINKGCIHSLSDTEGPQTYNVLATPPFNNGIFNITGTAKDKCSNIKISKYYIGNGVGSCDDYNPFLITGNMDPTDGSYDSLLENVRRLNAFYNHDGQNFACVKSWDVLDNVGNCNCSYFDTDIIPPDCAYDIYLDTQLYPVELQLCGDNAWLNATVCDSQSPIQGGEYFIDPTPNTVPEPWTGIWMNVLREFIDGRGYHCAVIGANVDTSQLSEGTHYIKLRGKDIVENWGKFLLCRNVSFIKDTKPPLTTKTMTGVKSKNAPQQRKRLTEWMTAGS